MSEYQSWVYDEVEFDIINLDMDNPDCWYCEPGYYPNLVGYVGEI